MASSLEEEAAKVFLETLARLDVSAAIRERVRLRDDSLMIDGERLPLAAFDGITLIAIGKASVAMASAFEAILGDWIREGLIVTDRRHRVSTRLPVIAGGHPLPDAGSLAAGRMAVDLIEQAPPNRLLLFCISGGGSALIEKPLWPEVTLDDIQELNRILITCGATISEINCLRKHFSAIKGGWLGALSRSRQCVAFYISDVNPGDLRAIASNPLLPDEATLELFHEVLGKYQLLKRLPESLQKRIEAHQVPPLPLQGSGERVKTVLLMDNHTAIREAAAICRRLGFEVEEDFDHQEGRYEAVADELLARLRNMRTDAPEKRVALVSGGEVVCPVRGPGLGGRNQEFVLYSAAQLAASCSNDNVAVLSCGTDGIDGNSPAAGAVAGAALMRESLSRSLNPSAFLLASDSHAFFREMGGLVVTGPTGNNVRDLRLLLAAPAGPTR